MMEKGSPPPVLAVCRPRPRANRPEIVSAITSRTMSNTRSPTLLGKGIVIANANVTITIYALFVWPSYLHGSDIYLRWSNNTNFMETNSKSGYSIFPLTDPAPWPSSGAGPWARWPGTGSSSPWPGSPRRARTRSCRCPLAGGYWRPGTRTLTSPLAPKCPLGQCPLKARARQPWVAHLSEK